MAKPVAFYIKAFGLTLGRRALILIHRNGEEVLRSTSPIQSIGEWGKFTTLNTRYVPERVLHEEKDGYGAGG